MRNFLLRLQLVCHLTSDSIPDPFPEFPTSWLLGWRDSDAPGLGFFPFRMLFLFKNKTAASQEEKIFY